MGQATATAAGAGGSGSGKDKDRLSVAMSDSSNSTAMGSSAPLSPSSIHGRMPWKADPPSLGLDKQEEDQPIRRTGSPLLGAMRSAPPSPVKEESSSHGHGDEEEGENSKSQKESAVPERNTVSDQELKSTRSRSTSSPQTAAQPEQPRRRDAKTLSPDSAFAPPEAAFIKGTSSVNSSPTPKKRRKSLAPSERSVKSAAGAKVGQAHPGIIRLFATFNDSTSLCE
jgi:3-phosphoinositide dependent protein kinase-1